MEPIANVEEIDLQKYVQVVQRRWLAVVGVFGVIVTAASVYAFSLKPVYKSEASLLINRTNNTSSLTGLGGNLGTIEAVALQGSLLETQAKMVTSVPVMQETIKSLKLKDQKGKLLTIKALSSKLKVDVAKGTDAILQISYADNDPEKAAKIVNKVIDTYVATNISENQSEAVMARQFLLKQLPASEGSVRQAELTLRNFKEQNNILILQQEALNAVDIISKLEAEITNNKAELVEINAHLRNLRRQTKSADSQQAVTSADLSQIRGTQDVLTQLQTAESQLKVERTRLQSEHPFIINLEEKVVVLKSLLDERKIQINIENGKTPVGNLQIGELRQKLIGEMVETENKSTALAEKINKLSQEKSNYQRRAKTYRSSNKLSEN